MPDPERDKVKDLAYAKVSAAMDEIRGLVSDGGDVLVYYLDEITDTPWINGTSAEVFSHLDPHSKIADETLLTLRGPMGTITKRVLVRDSDLTRLVRLWKVDEGTGVEFLAFECNYLKSDPTLVNITYQQTPTAEPVRKWTFLKE